METVTMTNKEADRLKVISNVLEGKLTWKEASNQLGLCIRQMGYLVAKVRQAGNRGVIHGLRGHPSNHQLKAGLLDRALKIIKDKYSDFKPTLANEKLAENHHIRLSTSSLRKGMLQEGIYQPGKQQRIKHRAWRERKACLGEMTQLDGSHHRWFEDRGPKCVLIAFIDDATSKILYGEFIGSENALEVFKATKSYLLRHGRPTAFYADKHGIFHVNQQAVVEEHLRDPYPMTQYTRAMNELGIEMIPAHSPQAKGRVERSFKTLQDRLIKEMRLRNISTPQEGNKFFWDFYIEDYNKRFAVPPLNPTNVHKSLKGFNLDEILAFKTQRTLLNDFTIRFKNEFFQILKDQPIALRPKDKVMVQIHLNGSIHLRYKGHKINFRLIIRKSLEELLKDQRAKWDTLPKTFASHLPLGQGATVNFERLKAGLTAGVAA